MNIVAFPELSGTEMPGTTAATTMDHFSLWVVSPARRGLDCCAAAAALFCCLPLFMLAAVAVRLSSPGPVLFRQRRVGRHGVTFTLYKFRSMRVNDQGGVPITILGDRRVTKVGQFLRRFKLDELPQLWNVLCGDMALVGPRPKLPQHEGLNLCWRPGLTGAASLAFRDEEELLSEIPEEQLEEVYERYVKPTKACLDSEYMLNATLLSDIEILWKTAVSCLTPWKCARVLSADFLESPLARPLCSADIAQELASLTMRSSPTRKRSALFRLSTTRVSSSTITGTSSGSGTLSKESELISSSPRGGVCDACSYNPGGAFEDFSTKVISS